jgi:predicted N-formylglutamate amidohydrolase
MNHMQPALPKEPVLALNPEGRSCVIVVCEHASRFIPPAFCDLGLDEAARQSHIAWDPGALEVALGLAQRLDAKLIASNVSRLVYDCNRPPAAEGATPARSEVTEVPGNANLTSAQRDERTAIYYEPFRGSLAAAIAATPDPVIVTVHSFTPIYHAKPRAVEIGVLHDADTRLSGAMMQSVRAHTDLDVRINEPYGPEDGVTHTLKEHAIEAGHLNVMLEIRNDLIESPQQQDAMAACLASWLSDALGALNVSVGARC